MRVLPDKAAAKEPVAHRRQDLFAFLRRLNHNGNGGGAANGDRDGYDNRNGATMLST